MAGTKSERSQLGDLLVEMGLVGREQLNSAITQQRATGGRLARILAERRLVDEDRIAKAISAKLGLEAVNLSSLRIHERVLAIVPASVALKHGALPIAIKRANQVEYVYVVMADPLDGEAIAELQRVSGRQIRVLVATASEVDRALEQHYRAAAEPARSALAELSSPIPPPKPAGGVVTHTPSQGIPSAPGAKGDTARRGLPPLSGSSLPAASPAPVALQPSAPPFAASAPPAFAPPPSAVASAGVAQPPGASPALRGRPAFPPLGGTIAPSPMSAGTTERRTKLPLPLPPLPAAMPAATAANPPSPALAAPAPAPRALARSAPPAAPARQAPPAGRAEPVARSEERQPGPAMPRAASGAAMAFPRAADLAALGPTISGGIPATTSPGQGLPPLNRPAPAREARDPREARELKEASSAMSSGARDVVSAISAEGDRTRIEPEPGFFPEPPQPDLGPRAEPTNTGAAGLDARDWEVDARGWERGSASPRPQPATGSGLGALGAPAAQAPASHGTLEEHVVEPVTSEASLEELAMVQQAALAAQSSTNAEEPSSDEIRIEIPEASDGPEDITTSQVELLDEPELARLGVLQKAAAFDRGAVIGALEVPIDLADAPSPFEGPGMADVPTGLERTGIIPALDWQSDEFVPPPLTKWSDPDRAALAAGSDIPLSPAMVRARFDGAPQFLPEPGETRPSKEPKDPPAERIDPPKPEPRSDTLLEERSSFLDLQQPFLLTQEVTGDASEHDSETGLEPPSRDRKEPKSDRGDAGGGGRTQPVATRVFDESSRQASRVRLNASRPEGEEEPTNPRIDTQSVKAALGDDRLFLVPPAPTRLDLDPWSEADHVLTPIPGLRSDSSSGEVSAPLSSDERTPPHDEIDRGKLLAGLGQTAVTPAGDNKTSAASFSDDDAERMVDALLAGDSLNSADRAQLVLAIGRLLVREGILKRDDLIDELQK